MPELQVLCLLFELRVNERQENSMRHSLKKGRMNHKIFLVNWEFRNSCRSKPCLGGIDKRIQIHLGNQEWHKSASSWEEIGFSPLRFLSFEPFQKIQGQTIAGF